jgi:hypothetical protein
VLGTLAEIHDIARGRAEAKGVLRQWLEMLVMILATRNGPAYYQMAALWRRDRGWSDIVGHWSYRRYLAEIDRLNHTGYRKISQYKLAEKAYLTQLGVPTPRLIGFLDPATGRDTRGLPLRDARDLERLFAEDPADRVCFKLIEGWAGRGFVPVDVIRDRATPRFRVLGEPVVHTAAELLARPDLADGEARLIEAYVASDPVFASFNPSSLNTLRLWVLRRGTKAVTRLAYLRVGRAGAHVDNDSPNRVVVPVDPDTGRLGAAHDGKKWRRTYPMHPDHGAPIEGVVLPRFAEAKALAESTLVLFPQLDFAGMDIAMSVTGPLVIELNPQPDREGAPFVGMTTRAAFEAA